MKVLTQPTVIGLVITGGLLIDKELQRNDSLRSTSRALHENTHAVTLGSGLSAPVDGDVLARTLTSVDAVVLPASTTATSSGVTTTSSDGVYHVTNFTITAQETNLLHRHIGHPSFRNDSTTAILTSTATPTTTATLTPTSHSESLPPLVQPSTSAASRTVFPGGILGRTVQEIKRWLVSMDQRYTNDAGADKEPARLGWQKQSQEARRVEIPALDVLGSTEDLMNGGAPRNVDEGRNGGTAYLTHADVDGETANITDAGVGGGEANRTLVVGGGTANVTVVVGGGTANLPDVDVLQKIRDLEAAIVKLRTASMIVWAGFLLLILGLVVIVMLMARRVVELEYRLYIRPVETEVVYVRDAPRAGALDGPDKGPSFADSTRVGKDTAY